MATILGASAEEESLSSNSNQVKEEKIYELLFGGGAGAIGFEMGFSQAILEIVGKEKLKKYRFGAVSCGCACAAFFYASIHTDLDMKYWYNSKVRAFFAKENRKYCGLITNGSKVRKIAEEFYDWHIQNKIEPVSKWLNVVTTKVTGALNFEAWVVDDFRDKVDFGNAVEASCTIPILTTLGLYCKFRNAKTIDGGFSSPIPYKYENSHKIFINVLPRLSRIFKSVRPTPKNIQYIDTAELGIKFPLDYYLWDQEWSDSMFLKGYFAGKNQEAKIKQVFDN